MPDILVANLSGSKYFDFGKARSENDQVLTTVNDLQLFLFGSIELISVSFDQASVGHRSLPYVIF